MATSTDVLVASPIPGVRDALRLAGLVRRDIAAVGGVWDRREESLRHRRPASRYASVLAEIGGNLDDVMAIRSEWLNGLLDELAESRPDLAEQIENAAYEIELGE